jgi:hypothetical protein
VKVTALKYLQENDYAFEENKPQVLTHLTNLENSFKNHFSNLLFHTVNGSEIHLLLHLVKRQISFL